MGQWVDAIVAAIRGKVELRQARAEAVERIAGGGFRIKTGGDWLETENLVIASEAHNAAKLLDGRLAELLNKVGYSSSVLVVFGYDAPQPMPGFGFLIPRRERLQILAATFVGTKFPHRAPQGLTLVRCFLSGEAEPDVDSIHRELQNLSGISGKPRFHRIFRWPRSMAQYTVGHNLRNAEIQQLVAATPGLHLAGNAYGGIGIPDCVRSGKQAAAKILV
jgi:oxygen-dependent protoporphyrinogen oxidase